MKCHDDSVACPTNDGDDHDEEGWQTTNTQTTATGKRVTRTSCANHIPNSAFPMKNNRPPFPPTRARKQNKRKSQDKTRDGIQLRMQLQGRHRRRHEQQPTTAGYQYPAIDVLSVLLLHLHDHPTHSLADRSASKVFVGCSIGDRLYDFPAIGIPNRSVVDRRLVVVFSGPEQEIIAR